MKHHKIFWFQIYSLKHKITEIQSFSLNIIDRERMQIKFQVLASGSNGNCAIISTSEGALLIEAGISRSRLFKSLSVLKVEPDEIKGILISHAHTDHYGGLPVITERLKVPVICSRGTQAEFMRYRRFDSRWEAISNNAIIIRDNTPLFFGFATIFLLSTVHDVRGANSFRVNIGAHNFSFITDTGQILPQQLKAIQESTIALVEMNHDIPALYKSKRPKWLKERIKASHLSNNQTIGILDKLLNHSPNVLFFGHISGECNSPKLIQDSLALWGINREKFPWYCFICRRDKPGAIVTLSGRDRMHISQKSLDLKMLKRNYSPQKDLLSYFGEKKTNHNC